MSHSKINRREKIVRLVKEKRHITSAELSREFGVTEETIRKDLQELSERGELLRVFGGAAVREYGTERPLDQRNIQNQAEKLKISRAALNLISEGNLILLDAGSTISMFAKAIPPELHCTVLTNSLETVNILSDKAGTTVLCAGGKLHASSLSFQGILTEQAIGTYNAEKAFISCAAVDVELGVMDSNEEEARIKQCMVRMAREVYLLADSSKIGGIAQITICPIARLTGLITDDNISARAQAELESAGIQVIIAR